MDISQQDLQPSLNQEKFPDNDHRPDSMNELENFLSKALRIEDGDHASNVDGINKVVMESCESEEPDIQHSECPVKCWSKCDTFPFPNVTLPADSSANGGDEEPSPSPCQRSISLPTPLKLVSAMKGSREKHVKSQMKLTVTWAPDVYDPIPTSASHTVNQGKKQHKSKNKKNWKKDGKKKGSSSRGSSGKDKKHSRRAVGGGSGRSYKLVDVHERSVEANDEFDDLIVGSPDPHSYCGSSFLKKSLTKVHYSVAEAL